MNAALRPFVLVALVLAGGCRTSTVPEAKSLFNGRDLEGWVVMHGGEWTVEGGELVGRRGVDWSTNPEKSGSWLRTAQEYGNFGLELEYAINVKGNSGIFLRSALEKNPAFTGNELQILDDHTLPEAKTWSTGALYDVMAASKVMSKPAGEWNTVRLDVRGLKVNAWLNGEQILTDAPARSPRGYLGLQNHDATSEVRFRNIRLTR